MRRHLRRLPGVLALALAVIARAVLAHPMPNTEISVSLREDGARLEIAVPAPELRLALPPEWPENVDLLAEPHRSAVLGYFNSHFAVRSAGGDVRPHRIEEFTRRTASDPEVGDYEELRLSLFVPADEGFDPRAFTLHYDAVIHQVPNHHALVYIAQDFRSGLLHEHPPGVQFGTIRYDFARDSIPGLAVNPGRGSIWRGIRAAIALGFHHVITGIDHLLFLVTLLVVAPLRKVDGRWSLFQGWPYTARRFLAISLAFTAGHSVSLSLGTWQLFPVPRTPVEILIAGSILIAAIHAIRPLFSGREWVVAAAFGTVHGLAFSEDIATFGLPPWTRAQMVLGFNLGVEGAQLVAMCCALPLLFASRWRGFHVLRIVAMAVTAAVAAAWIVERAGWWPGAFQGWLRAE